VTASSGEAPPAEARDLLERIAFRQAAETAARGVDHGSRLARVARGSWQAQAIRRAEGTVEAGNAEEFRSAMENPAALVVFLPQSFAVTAEIIAEICRNSPLDKFIVWEAD
jgi:hypothetical protein